MRDITVGDFSRTLPKGWGEITLFRWLRAERMLDGDNVPYQRWINSGHFWSESKSWENNQGYGDDYRLTWITGTGQDYLRDRIKRIEWARRLGLQPMTDAERIEIELEIKRECAA